jgi:hypothetical protein
LMTEALRHRFAADGAHPTLPGRVDNSIPHFFLP